MRHDSMNEHTPNHEKGQSFTEGGRRAKGIGYREAFAGELTEEVVEVDVEPPPLAVLVTSLPTICTYAKTPWAALPQLSFG